VLPSFGYDAPMRSLIVLMLCLAAGLARAQATQTWHADLASARAFMADAAKLYELKRKARVAVKTWGTMSALEAVARGQVDIVCAARPTDERFPAEKSLLATPAAWDALALIVHPGNPVKALTLKQLKAIYAGRIKNWSEVGGPSKPINLYAVAGPNDGVEYSLRRLLFGNGSLNVAAGRWYINTQQLEGAVAIDPLAIGVSLNSNIHANRGVYALAIEGVRPSLKTLESGEYLLPVVLYVAARRDTPGQEGSLQQARRALEFLRDEPALRKSMRAKQLVPAPEAVLLSKNQSTREQFIYAQLDVRLPQAVASGPPLPPAPEKTRLTNPTRRADHAAIVAADKTQPSADKNTRVQRAPADVAKVSACRPQPIC
jgi:phosphate transport system substrate-binding protein